MPQSNPETQTVKHRNFSRRWSAVRHEPPALIFGSGRTGAVPAANSGDPKPLRFQPPKTAPKTNPEKQS
jgi:hypothetical protein